MTRPTITAILQDGPRAGETVSLDVGHQDDPPKEFLLADEHLGARSADHRVDPPSGSVSTSKPAARRVAVAWSCCWPTTSGTAVFSLPRETTSVIV